MFSSRKKKEEAAPSRISISDPTLLPSAPIDSSPTLLDRRRPSIATSLGSDEILRVTSAGSFATSTSSKARVSGSAPGVGFHKPSGFTGAPAGVEETAERKAGTPGMDLPPIMNTPPRPPRADSIAALYSSPSASAVPYTSTFRASTSFDAQLSTLATTPPSLPNVRKSLKLPPTLNLLVAGARSSGKTSWIKTFLGTIRAANANEEAKLSQFAVVTENGIARTRAFTQVAAEIVVEGGGRLALTILDTAGLEVPYQVGKVGDAQVVERQVASIIADIEARFEITLAAESAVTRLSSRVQDDHLHLCVYFIHPSTITSRPVHRSAAEGEISGEGMNGRAADVEEVGMSEVDLRAIKELSTRVNVLPVLALSDTLTIAQMARMKSIIKRDLKRNQLDFGVFEADTWTGDDEATPVPSISKSFSSGAIKGQSGHSRRGTNASDAAQEEEEEEDEEEPESTDPPPKLIKLTRSLSLSTKLSSARHRPGTRSISKLAEAAALETRWNGASEDSAELEESLPFSLVAADFVESTAPTGGAMRYERKFAYGTIDILDGQHTDFMLLRNAILGKQLKLLRESTRVQKYESYRTTKLLHRRATTMLSEPSKAALSNEISPLSS